MRVSWDLSNNEETTENFKYIATKENVKQQKKKTSVWGWIHDEIAINELLVVCNQNCRQWFDLSKRNYNEESYIGILVKD